jgi:hypothetical protein
MRAAALLCLAMLAQAALALPERLADTGLDGAGVLAFAPQYSLWSDGATKRRWLYIPPGSAIDAANPARWEFPIGTKLWKEFAHGRPIETRFIERLADGAWRYATYVWNEEGTQATLAPEEGFKALPVAGAPAGRYRVPARADCRVCHDGARVPVLGASALQLAPELGALVARAWLRNLPPALLEHPPRIAAASALERAALGYLHANCGHCHNDTPAAPPVDLVLDQQAEKPGAGLRERLSLVLERMRTRAPRTQMPPLGTAVPDPEALALIERWIRDSSPTLQKEPHP